MKRTLAVFLVMIIAFSLASCLNEQGGVSTPETETTVAVESVTLDKTEISLEVGGNDEAATVILVATVIPDEATNKDLTWTSSDETVVTVVHGIVRALKEGTATITVTTKDGDKEAACEVVVTQHTHELTNLETSGSERHKGYCAGCGNLVEESHSYTKGDSLSSCECGAYFIDTDNLAGPVDIDKSNITVYVKSLIGYENGSRIVISANNVTVDLCGQCSSVSKLNSGYYSGIEVSNGVTGLILRNGTISTTSSLVRGICFNGSVEVTFENISVNGYDSGNAINDDLRIVDVNAASPNDVVIKIKIGENVKFNNVEITVNSESDSQNIIKTYLKVNLNSNFTFEVTKY